MNVMLDKFKELDKEEKREFLEKAVASLDMDEKEDIIVSIIHDAHDDDYSIEESVIEMLVNLKTFELYQSEVLAKGNYINDDYSPVDRKMVHMREIIIEQLKNKAEDIDKDISFDDGECDQLIEKIDHYYYHTEDHSLQSLENMRGSDLHRLVMKLTPEQVETIQKAIREMR